MMASSWSRDISPPPTRKRSPPIEEKQSSPQTQNLPSLAAIEAGDAVIDDHLHYISERLQSLVSEPINSTPRLSISAFKDLYQRNLHEHGRHFVVHQHDHPISGVHYDLRLQFSKTSTISFAIPYGLPGNSTSIRPNRMAIETRVHNLWNNLIESASRQTGSLLVWDTGEYQVLPYREDTARTTDDELTDEDVSPSSESQRLFKAFQEKHIRLRLHGCRLPAGYTISLRLPRNSYKPGHAPDPARKRRRRQVPKKVDPDDSDQSSSETVNEAEDEAAEEAALASEDEEDATIRANNAYTGATNTIGSVHQRHWFLSLDKKNSPSSTSFLVLGREVERSIVTGRNADEMMKDDSVAKFVGRKMWRPIIE